MLDVALSMQTKVKSAFKVETAAFLKPHVYSQPFRGVWQAQNNSPTLLWEMSPTMILT